MDLFFFFMLLKGCEIIDFLDLKKSCLFLLKNMDLMVMYIIIWNVINFVEL